MSNPPGGFGDAGVPLHASPHGQLRAQDRGGTLSVGAAGLTISEVFPASPVGSEEAGGGGAGVPGSVLPLWVRVERACLLAQHPVPLGVLWGDLTD